MENADEVLCPCRCVGYTRGGERLVQDSIIYHRPVISAGMAGKVYHRGDGAGYTGSQREHPWRQIFM